MTGTIVRMDCHSGSKKKNRRDISICHFLVPADAILMTVPIAVRILTARILTEVFNRRENVSHDR